MIRSQLKYTLGLIRLANKYDKIYVCFTVATMSCIKYTIQPEIIA